MGKGFNRDYWARFERFVKDVAQRADSVYIVTGPLWLPRPDDAAGGDKWVMQHPLIGAAGLELARAACCLLTALLRSCRIEWLIMVDGLQRRQCIAAASLPIQRCLTA